MDFKFQQEANMFPRVSFPVLTKRNRISCQIQFDLNVIVWYCLKYLDAKYFFKNIYTG